MPTLVDPNVLLCESCGYVIEGLPETGSCPECGQLIEKSLPQHRDTRADLLKWSWRGGLELACRPSSTFAVLRMDRRAAKQIAVTNCYALGIISAVSQIPIAIAALTRDTDITGGHLAAVLLMPLMTGLGTMFYPILLTLIEFLGIQVFSRRKGWRVTRTVAGVVCDYATVGWVLGGVVSVPVSLVLVALVLAGTVRPQSEYTIVIPFLTALSVGLIWFEWLVYIGVRRCRFANLPRNPSN